MLPNLLIFDDMTLEELAIKYGTDKAEHGYCPHYEKLMPKKPNRILEIGVFKGASMRMWREYYPDCELHGLDLFEEHSAPLDIDDAIFWEGSQTDPLLLEVVRNHHFDVIIEDGSHNSIDQWVSFVSLMGCCDLYVVEDLHCCTDPFYSQGLRYEQTMLGRMKAGTFPFAHTLFDDKIAFIELKNTK